MSTYDYTRPRATADRLVTRFGQTGAIRRQTASGSENNPTFTPTDHECTLVTEAYKTSEIDGSRVMASDLKVILAKGDLAISPTTEDKLVIGGVPYSIVDVSPLSPGGVVVLWQMQVRR